MLAGAMVAVMAAATLDAAPVVQYTGALLLLALAVALVVGPPTERGRQVQWHRAGRGRAHGACE
jgi:NADH:ubiquinone oxidoreductase subunit 6 (subunit J)